VGGAACDTRGYGVCAGPDRLLAGIAALEAADWTRPADFEAARSTRNPPEAHEGSGWRSGFHRQVRTSLQERERGLDGYVGSARYDEPRGSPYGCSHQHLVAAGHPQPGAGWPGPALAGRRPLERSRPRLGRGGAGQRTPRVAEQITEARRAMRIGGLPAPPTWRSLPSACWAGGGQLRPPRRRTEAARVGDGRRVVRRVDATCTPGRGLLQPDRGLRGAGEWERGCRVVRAVEDFARTTQHRPLFGRAARSTRTCCLDRGHCHRRRSRCRRAGGTRAVRPADDERAGHRCLAELRVPAGRLLEAEGLLAATSRPPIVAPCLRLAEGRPADGRNPPGAGFPPATDHPYRRRHLSPTCRRPLACAYGRRRGRCCERPRRPSPSARRPAVNALADLAAGHVAASVDETGRRRIGRRPGGR
jgi:hypothetical protein